MTYPRQRYIPKPSNTTYKPDFHRYEVLKQLWLSNNRHRPYTSDEYQEAVREIARRCGI